MDSPGYLTLGRAGLVHWSPGWFLGGRGQEAATSSPSLPALSLKATATEFQPVFELALFPGLGDKCLVLCSLLP